MEYKINIHAHTMFSDGNNTPLAMAMKAKELEFTSLVITDHYYSDTTAHFSLNYEKMWLLNKAVKEAKKILPIIAGIELEFHGEEILVFGSSAINSIMEMRESGKNITKHFLLELKDKNDCAFILCHPGSPANWKYLLPLLDGYEEFNSGRDLFAGRERGVLEGLVGWCNSDAHMSEQLERSYNLVDSKIKTEGDLIKYIKRKKQPVFKITAEYNK